MSHHSLVVLRAVRDAVLTTAGSVAIGVAIVIAGLAWLDEAAYDGAVTEAAYVAFAVAALAVCGFGVLVALGVVTAPTRDGSAQTGRSPASSTSA